MFRIALIAGVTGIVGNNLAHHLLANGWQVHGLARRPSADIKASTSSPPTSSTPPPYTPPSPASSPLISSSPHGSASPPKKKTSASTAPWCATSSSRRPGPQLVHHVALVTGLKHYLGPFESYGKGTLPATPFREEQPPPRHRKLLLRPGRRGLRRRSPRRLHLEHPSPPHHHRLRARQRHEHGRHPRRLRHHLPRNRPTLSSPAPPPNGTASPT